MSEQNNIDPKEVIPTGPYCYSGTRNPSDNRYKPCPYWRHLGEQNGECLYLGIQDYEENEHGETSLALWDQVKECGINNDWDD